jgi:hypothetical protein
MDYHYEIFKNVGQGHCPGCDTDGFFCLLEETLWVSSTYHLVCNTCGHKAPVSRKTARTYMPHRSVWQTHMFLIAVLAVISAGVAGAIITLIRG